MKIIFLDIDGCLNSQTSMKKNGEEKNNIEDDTPTTEAIARLNKIVEATNAKVVISSTWRHGVSYHMMQRYLSVLGFKGKIIGNTPRLDSYRGTEILCWLLEHKSKIIKNADSTWYQYKEPIESFVILDDDSDMESLSNHLVHINNMVGLLDSDVDKAIEVLNNNMIPVVEVY